MTTVVLGVEVGVAEIGAAPVDTLDGELVTDCETIETVHPGTPEQVIETIGALADRFAWCGSIGVAFPGVVEEGIVRTAPHLDPSWSGVDLARLVSDEIGEPTTAINDADAAGIAEMAFGAGFGHRGVVIVVTLGAAVGTSVFVDGLLLPNTELGHVLVRGQEMERRVAARAELDTASGQRWGREIGSYLETLEDLFWPKLFVLGGAASRNFAEVERYLHTRTPVVPARNGDTAGIIGAAVAHSRLTHSSP